MLSAWFFLRGSASFPRKVPSSSGPVFDDFGNLCFHSSWVLNSLIKEEVGSPTDKLCLAQFVMVNNRTPKSLKWETTLTSLSLNLIFKRGCFHNGLDLLNELNRSPSWYSTDYVNLRIYFQLWFSSLGFLKRLLFCSPILGIEMVDFNLLPFIVRKINLEVICFVYSDYFGIAILGVVPTWRDT